MAFTILLVCSYWLIAIPQESEIAGIVKSVKAECGRRYAYFIMRTSARRLRAPYNIHTIYLVDLAKGTDTAEKFLTLHSELVRWSTARAARLPLHLTVLLYCSSKDAVCAPALYQWRGLLVALQWPPGQMRVQYAAGVTMDEAIASYVSLDPFEVLFFASARTRLSPQWVDWLERGVRSVTDLTKVYVANPAAMTSTTKTRMRPTLSPRELYTHLNEKFSPSFEGRQLQSGVPDTVAGVSLVIEGAEKTAGFFTTAWFPRFWNLCFGAVPGEVKSVAEQLSACIAQGGRQIVAPVAKQSFVRLLEHTAAATEEEKEKPFEDQGDCSKLLLTTLKGPRVV